MLFCLIPAKPYAESKSRLAACLSLEGRVALSRWLLRRTVRLARVVVGPVVVVSHDPALLADAQAEGAWGLPEAGDGLNPALAQAARFAQAQGADGVLALPIDLPCLTAADLEAMLALAGGEASARPGLPPALGQAPAGEAGLKPALPAHPAEADLKPALPVHPAVVIAPCRRESGTNALLLRPADLVPFSFGPASFAAHCAAARAAGVEPAVYRSASIALDLDTPEDWRMVDLLIRFKRGSIVSINKRKSDLSSRGP